MHYCGLCPFSQCGNDYVDLFIGLLLITTQCSNYVEIATSLHLFASYS